MICQHGKRSYNFQRISGQQSAFPIHRFIALSPV